MRPPDIVYLTDIYFGHGSVEVVPDLLERFASGGRCWRPIRG
jgi:hypothetical protein